MAGSTITQAAPGAQRPPRVGRTLYSQTSCQKGRPRATGAPARIGGFTLIELLVVICILGILGSALVVSVQSGYKQARQANCKSNLRQFGVALTIYRGEHDNRTPPWISCLFPEYVDNLSMYVCRADKNAGKDTPRPPDLLQVIRDTGNSIDNASFWDNQQNGNQERNNGQGRSGPVKACSYFYEFSGARVGWGGITGYTPPPNQTMADYKVAQMTYGDQNNVINGIQTPYSASRIPILRCYHHWRDQRVYGRGGPGQSISRQPITINVAYAGNVFVGPTWWEGTLHLGDAAN
jgi:prepilin-type N-terminal cleavage/methylation domain-containing protein